MFQKKTQLARGFNWVHHGGGKIQLSYTFSANSWGRPAEDLTPKFQSYFKRKAKNISMQELDNNDKTFYLEKPKTLNIEKD